MSDYMGNEKNPPGRPFRDGSPMADGFADVRADVTRAMGKMEGVTERWIRTTVLWSDIPDGASPQNVVLRSPGAEPLLVRDAFVRVVANMTGGTLADMTVSVGRSGLAGAFMVPQDCFGSAADGTQANAVPDGLLAAEKGADHPLTVPGSPYISAEDLVATFASTTDDPGNATAGEVEVWLKLAEPTAVPL